MKAILFFILLPFTVLAQCPPGKNKIIVEPFASTSGNDFFTEVSGYAARAHKYPTFSYPNLTVNPGDTIALRGSFDFNRVELYGYEGTAECPIILTVEDPNNPVRIYEGIYLYDVKNMKVTGRRPGDNNMKTDTFGIQSNYGIQVISNGVRKAAILATGFIEGLEVDRIYGENNWYAMQIKTDPMQDDYPGCDTMYSGENHRIRNIKLHHCFFKNFTQDGFYIGNTDDGTRKYKCLYVSSDSIFMKPFRMGDVHSYNNRILIGGRTALQYARVDSGLNTIHDNYITDMGDELNQSQGVGILLGQTSGTDVYKNHVSKTFLSNYSDGGVGLNRWFQNWGDSAGFLNLAVTSGQWLVNNPGGNIYTYVDGQPAQFQRRGDWLVNIYQSSQHSFFSSAKPSFPQLTKTIHIFDNTFGRNAGGADTLGAIAFYQYGPDVWTTANLICRNVRKTGGAVAIQQFNFYDDAIPGFTGIMKPVYSTNCPALSDGRRKTIKFK